jgi:hypothetical protein
VAVCFAVVGLFPGLIDQIATRLGIAYPPMLAITVAVALLVIKILLMDIERSRSETRNQRLVQRLAILESELRELQEPARDGHTGAP